MYNWFDQVWNILFIRVLCNENVASSDEKMPLSTGLIQVTMSQRSWGVGGGVTQLHFFLVCLCVQYTECVWGVTSH